MVVADHTGKRRVVCRPRLHSVSRLTRPPLFFTSFSCALPDAATKSDARGVMPDGGEDAR